MAFIVGDRGLFAVEWRHQTTNALADPTTITFMLQRPDQTVLTGVFGVDIDLHRTGVGLYHYEYTFTQGGFWEWRWVATGAVVAACQGRVCVDAAIVP